MPNDFPDVTDLDFGPNKWFVDQLYEDYLNDKNSVAPQWQLLFSKRDARLPTQPTSLTKPDIKAAGSSQEHVQPSKTKLSSTSSTEKALTTVNSDRFTTVSSPQATPSKTVPTTESHEPGAESPSQPGLFGLLGPDVPKFAPETQTKEPDRQLLRAAAKRTAANMDASLTIPTATSVRSVPMKLAIENRATINNFLKRSRGGKVSFTHIIGFAVIQALKKLPEMNVAYGLDDGKPTLISNHNINLGLAIDTTNNKGERQLLVPNIKACENLNFAQFFLAYEQLVEKARHNKLTVDDFAHTTATLTNPGGIGTVMSVPRLMNGQGVIIGVGAINYGADFEGSSAQVLTDNAVSKVTNLTSTYDHRVIQGALSGEFLRVIHQQLIGQDNFYENIFEALRIPYPPMHWASDIHIDQPDQVSKDARVAMLINAYRTVGHVQADTDPVQYQMRTHPTLELEHHGLTLWDLDRSFPVQGIAGGINRVMKLRDILDVLQASYAHTVSIEYMHIKDPLQRKWIQQRFEKPHIPRPREEHLRILDKLSEAEVFETFLQTKYVGQTRFSLEGAESAIVILAFLCEQASNDNFNEVCIGMPHRGRLNVLANICGKLYSQIFREFENKYQDTDDISGDVKYHLGTEGKYHASSGKSVTASVVANPSHLESVNPVLEGIVRAKIDRSDNPETFPVLPLLIHGDASFSGQGVVYETLQMSQLRAYTTGGTIHLIINNQIGFTTGPLDAHSSTYCSDIAKSINIPVLHVNGDDPDACVRAAELAFEYRQTFHKDIVIDMICYRRRGHNEGDDPSFTQPLMYDLIDQKRPVRKIYTEQLIGRGDISMADAEAAVNRFRNRLEDVLTNVRNPDVPRESDPYRMVPSYPPKQRLSKATAATPEQLKRISEIYSDLPAGFQLHPKVEPQLQRRAQAIMEGPIDWATAETLAFGTLLMNGMQIRLAGQDSRRGTFSQRFGAVVDPRTGDAWVPLKHLSPNQGRFDIYDSLLSEFSALGFEYGYSVAAPNSLVLWEAQYGDFVNGAQTIIDEFITSGYAKWTQRSGVVLLLPHGYEGAGPDHSSSRIERFLGACWNDNIGVCQPSTPASYYHLLRHHAQVNWHRPVIIATPKSMLRNKLAVSMPQDFIGDSHWRPVIADPQITDPLAVKKVLLCSGKVRWALVNKRKELGLESQVAIISLERLYPLAMNEITAVLAQYPHVTDFRWVQEEPVNLGPWNFLQMSLFPRLSAKLRREFNIRVVARDGLASPATGSARGHIAEQKRLMSEAFE